jgi:hypothetical protein
VQLVLLAHVGATLSTAHAAPVRALKQFKVPTANCEPRSTTNGSDGNLWFTLGGENANVPSKTPALALVLLLPLFTLSPAQSTVPARPARRPEYGVVVIGLA